MQWELLSTPSFYNDVWKIHGNRCIKLFMIGRRKDSYNRSDADMSVNFSAGIRPASNLAQITLEPSNPEDEKYIKGLDFFDYSTVEKTDPPPPPALGWLKAIAIQVKVSTC